MRASVLKLKNICIYDFFFVILQSEKSHEMKRAGKITLVVFAVLIAALVVTLVMADVIVSRIVQKEVDKTVAQIPDVDISVGGINLFLLSGTAVVHDIHFATKSLVHLVPSTSSTDTNAPAALEPGLAVQIPQLTIGYINYRRLWREKKLYIHQTKIDDLNLTVQMDENNPKSLLPALPEDTALANIGKWLKEISIRNIDVNRLHAGLRSTSGPLDMAIDSLSIHAEDIGYNLIDSIFSYNDSCYWLHIGSLTAALPDNESAIELHDLETRDEGPLQLGYTRFHHIITPKRLADRHREPTTWVDVELNRVETTPFNPIRKVLAGDYTLDSLHADVRQLHVCRDVRHAAKHPFPMPQDVLKKIPAHFEIKHLTAKVNKVDVELVSTDVSCGKMQVSQLQIRMQHVTNRHGAVWYNYAHAPFGPQGMVDARFNMHFDKSARFDVVMKGKKIEAATLNSFLRPLVGLTCSCMIDQVDAKYSGDRVKASGDFCMLYHGLDVQFHKDENVPYKIISKNSGILTSMAHSLIPKSNPTPVDKHPRRYRVEWKRDDRVAFPIYLFGPCIKGVVETMLPGLFIHKQERVKKTVTPSVKQDKKISATKGARKKNK